MDEQVSFFSKKVKESQREVVYPRHRGLNPFGLHAFKKIIAVFHLQFEVQLVIRPASSFCMPGQCERVMS